MTMEHNFGNISILLNNQPPLANQQAPNNQMLNNFSSNIFPIKEKPSKKHKAENSPNSKRNLKAQNSKKTAKLLVQKSKDTVDKSHKQSLNMIGIENKKKSDQEIYITSSNKKKPPKTANVVENAIINKIRDCKSNIYIKNNLEKDFILKELNQLDVNLSKLGNSVSASNDVNSATSRKYRDEVAIKNNSLDVNLQRRDAHTMQQKRSPNYIIKRNPNTNNANNNNLEEQVYPKGKDVNRDVFAEFEKANYIVNSEKIYAKSKDKNKPKQFGAFVKNNNNVQNPNAGNFNKEKSKQLSSMANNYVFKAVNYWVEFNKSNQNEPENSLNVKKVNVVAKRPNYC